ncbi:MAG TPA: hypothetical protein VMF50_01525, partial [Candidatus Binataceae bacterium]|nr:hypothetical protein [Candidatus Binataceae bacterium]
KLPANIASLKGIKWGRRRYADDIVLDRPVLIAYRHSDDWWQALYKTIERPALGKFGDRGFLFANNGRIFEQSIQAIMKWCWRAHWEWLEEDQTK